MRLTLPILTACFIIVTLFLFFDLTYANVEKVMIVGESAKPKELPASEMPHFIEQVSLGIPVLTLPYSVQPSPPFSVNAPDSRENGSASIPSIIHYYRVPTALTEGRSFEVRVCWPASLPLDLTIDWISISSSSNSGPISKHHKHRDTFIRVQSNADRIVWTHQRSEDIKSVPCAYVVVMDALWLGLVPQSSWRVILLVLWVGIFMYWIAAPRLGQLILSSSSESTSSKQKAS